MAYTPRISSKQTLVDYVMRFLGAPVLKINVDPDQVDDRIDDALERFWQYHADGVQRQFYKHPLTQAEIDAQSVNLPTNIMSVLRVLPIDGQDILSINNLQYVMYITDIMDIRRFNGEGLSTYANTMSYLNTIDNLFNYEKVVEFNVHKNTLSLQTDWTQMTIGSYMLVECYVALDPTQYSSIWGDYWFRRYVVALIKRQWGWNLIKYTGNTLPGGVTINADTIYREGVTEVTALEDELESKYTLPVDFFMS
jgi:hypothetical protein